MSYRRRPDEGQNSTEWFDREGSTRQLLSPHRSDMYLPSFFVSLVTDEVVPKIGVAALLSVLTVASGAYGQLFFVTLFVWAGDMLFGTLKAFKHGGFRLSKTGDGLLRGIVIVFLPGILAMVGEVGLDVLRIAFQIEMNIEVGLAAFGLAFLLAHEMGSLFDNVAKLHPGAHSLRARIVTWKPGGEEVGERQVEVAILDDPRDQASKKKGAP